MEQVIKNGHEASNTVKTGKKVHKTYYSEDPIADLAHLEEYYHSIQGMGISIPKYYGGRIYHQKKKIVTSWEDVGHPLTEKIINMSSEEAMSTLNKILNINYWSFLNKIALYPGLDSYSMHNQKIFYNDFFPAKRKKDFKEKNDAKQVILPLIFFGLVQKIALPVREMIKLRPELEEELVRLALEFVEQWGLGNLSRDLRILFDFQMPNNPKKKIKIDLNFSSGYENIVYFNPQAKIISLSPKCIWTPYLLYRDMDACKEMGFVFGEF